MKKVYTVWCEWDIGHNSLVFDSPELAMGFIKEVDWVSLNVNEDFKEMEKGDIVNILLEDDMVGFNEKEVKIMSNENIANASSADFKSLLKTNIIPRTELMEKKEREHLHWLIDNNAPTEFVATAQKCLFHYAERIKEYNEYYNKLP